MDKTPENPAQEIARLRQTIVELEEAFLAKQTALSNVIRHIRATLDLDTIFQSTVQEIRHLLEADRVAVFEFSSETHHRTGTFIAEEVAPDYDSALAKQATDYCFGDNYANIYRQGKIYAVADIEVEPLSECHRDIMRRFQVRANLVVPLIKQNELWGLLCVHQCSQPRKWTRQDIEFAREVASHLDMALQHTELFQKLQDDNRKQLQKIAENAPGALYQFRRDTNGEFSFPYVSPVPRAFLKSPAAVLKTMLRLFLN